MYIWCKWNMNEFCVLTWVASPRELIMYVIPKHFYPNHFKSGFPMAWCMTKSAYSHRSGITPHSRDIPSLSSNSLTRTSHEWGSPKERAHAGWGSASGDRGDGTFLVLCYDVCVPVIRNKSCIFQSIKLFWQARKKETGLQEGRISFLTWSFVAKRWQT